MKITDVRTRCFRIPPKTTWQDATESVAILEFVIVEVHTNDEIQGTGIAYTLNVGGAAIKTLIDVYCTPLLLGMNPLHVEQVWNRLSTHLRRVGNGGIDSLAVAALDIANWDIVSKSRGLPLYQALGGARDEIQAYGSGIDLHMAPAQLKEHVQRYCQQGYRAVKIKVGRQSLREDVERLSAARDAIGHDRLLLLDANQAWHVGEALRRIQAFEPFQPAWIEEPLVPADVHGYARLRRSCTVPIASGEFFFTSSQFREYLRLEALDYLQPDVVRIGGVTECIKVFNLASAWNLPVAPHFLSELSIHLLCAMPNGFILENVTGGSLFELGVTNEPVSLIDGLARPPSTPGHGIHFDESKLKQYEVLP